LQNSRAIKESNRLGSQNTLSTSIWLARAAPAVGPYPETTFRTPSGRPA